MNRKMVLQGGGAVLAVMLLGGVSALAAGAVEPARAPVPLPQPVSSVPAGPYQAVCPDPARLLRSDVAGNDPEFSPLARTARSKVSAVVLSDLSGALPATSLTPLAADKPIVTLGEKPAPSATAGKDDPAGKDSTQESGPPVASTATGLTQLKAAVVRGQRISRATVLTADPSGTRQSSAGGVMLYRADDGDLRGIAAANCQEPANEHWLVGANTTVGATAVLRLTNSSPTPAIVNTELFGNQGRIKAGGSRGLLVAPGETRSVVLAGLAANQPQLSVRVRSSGGPVTATIQQSVLRALTPGGVEFLQPTEPAALQQFIPGLQVQARSGFRDDGSDGSNGRGPALQVLVPGRADAVLDVSVYGAKGRKPLPGGGRVRATAGGVTEVALDSLPAGTYSIGITSNVPVVASARSVRGFTSNQPEDLAWSGAGRQLGSDHLVPFTADAVPTLVFGSPAGRSQIRITPLNAKGQPGTEKTIQVKGGTTLTVTPSRLSAQGVAAVMISASGDPVYGTQVLAARGGAITAIPIAPGATPPPPVNVRLGY